MNFVEIGKADGPTVLMVYPGDWTKISDLKELEDKYHVVIPQIRDGEHKGDVASIAECIRSSPAVAWQGSQCHMTGWETT